MKNVLKLVVLMLLVSMVVAACGTNNEPVAEENTPVATPDTPVSEPVVEDGAVTLPPAEKSKITLRLNWKFKGEFTPFFVTKELGIFEKYGLDVDVLEGSGSVQTLQVIAQYKDDIGVTSTVEPMQGIEQEMPIKMIASYMSRSPILVLSYPDNPVKTPKDLEGKSLATSTSSTFTSFYDKFIQFNDTDPSKVKLVKVETGARNNLFLNKEVDAVAVFATNEYPVFEKTLGIKLETMYAADFGFDVAGLTLIAHNKFLNENPNTAKRFLAAVNEGFQYTLDNPEEAAAIAKKLFPDTVDVALTVEQIKRTGELAVLKDKPFGWIDSTNIDETADRLLESKIIEKKLPIEQYFTNEFMQ